MKDAAPSLDLTSIDHSLSTALNLLRRTFTPVGKGLGGWYHLLAQTPPGPTATALGLSSFLESTEAFEHIEEGLSFLASRQLTSTDSTLDGGWPLNTSLGRPVVEATGWVVRFLGLARCTQVTCAPNIERGYRWLLANQNPDGGWGSLLGAPSRVWLTCIALRGIVQVDPYSPAVERGVEWLMSHQSSDPCGWGDVKGHQVSTTHTAMSLLTIAEIRPGWSDNRVIKAYDWLEEHLDTASIDDQNARVEGYIVEAEVRGQRQPWHTILLHYGLPIAMSALMRHPHGAQGNVVCSGYRTIVRAQQPTGEWRNIQGGNDASIWAVWPFIQALLDAKRLPMSRPKDTITWTRHVIVIQRAGGPPDALLELLRIQRRLSVQRFFARYWSVLLVMLSVLTGLVLVGVGSLDLKDYLLGLIVPISLFVVQELLKRRAG